MKRTFQLIIGVLVLGVIMWSLSSCSSAPFPETNLDLNKPTLFGWCIVIVITQIIIWVLSLLIGGEELYDSKTEALFWLGLCLFPVVPLVVIVIIKFSTL